MNESNEKPLSDKYQGKEMIKTEKVMRKYEGKCMKDKEKKNIFC